jgi:hypothetical protein
MVVSTSPCSPPPPSGSENPPVEKTSGRPWVILPVVPDVKAVVLARRRLGTYRHLAEEELVLRKPLGLGTHGQVTDEHSGWHQVRQPKPTRAPKSSMAGDHAVGENSSWHGVRRSQPPHHPQSTATGFRVPGDEALEPLPMLHHQHRPPVQSGQWSAGAQMGTNQKSLYNLQSEIK